MSSTRPDRASTSKRTALALLVALATTGAFVSQVARADDVADEADLQFQLGAARYKENDYLGALEHFLASNRLAPNHNVVFNIARCYEHLERFSDAYRFYAIAGEAQNTPERRAQIEEALGRIKPKVAVLEVKTNPPGATIYLDRKELGARGSAPRSLGLAAGTYTIIAELGDHEPVTSKPTTIALGTTTTIELELVPILATVVVTGPEATGAAVRVDDEKAAPTCTAPCTLKLSPGHHVLFLAREGFVAEGITVDLAPKGNVELRPKLVARTGSVVVDSDVKDSLVEIDGTPAGFTPAVLAVPVGEHTLRITHEGFRPFSRKLAVAAEAATKVDAELTEALIVGAASRNLESVDDAPASITIIPKYELVGMGYPTIAEALRGVRGVYVNDDRSYSSLGFRGFGRPGDYGNHVLVLVDGHPTNENYTGGASVGFDARTDLEDVERIEVVRGPGSALYGTSAFFGVVNVVTRGRDQPTHMEAGVSAVEYGVFRSRLHATYRVNDDAGLWVSLGGARSIEGRDFVFSEYAVDGANGASNGNDGFDAGTVTGRAWWKTLTLQWLYTARKKHIPTGVSDTIFPSHATQYLDRRGFLELKFEPKLGDVQTLTRMHANLYLYDDLLDYTYDVDPTTGAATGGPYRDSYRGEWFGLEERVAVPVTRTLRLTVGGEGQYHPITRQTSRTSTGDVVLSRNDPFTIGAGYLLADWTPNDTFKVSPALRVDYYSTTGTSLNPRLAVLIHASPDTTTKMLAGKAFRAPSVFELFYQSDTYRTPDALKPEDIYSGELEVSHHFSQTVSGTVSGYVNVVRNLIELSGGGTTADPNVYINSDRSILGTGVEAELRRDFRQGAMFAAQMSLQRTRYLDVAESQRREVPNSPNVLASLKGAIPIAQRALSLMSRLSYIGPRWDRYDRPGDPEQQRVDGALVWDLVFTGESERFRVRYGIGVYNVLDTRWFAPVSGEYRMRTIPQNGRTIYASLGITL